MKYLVIVFALIIALMAGAASTSAQQQQPQPQIQARDTSSRSDSLSVSGNTNANIHTMDSSTTTSSVEQVPTPITIDPSHEQSRIQQLLLDSERMSSQRLSNQQMDPVTIQHMQQLQQQQLYYWQQQQAVLAAAHHVQQQQQQQSPRREEEVSSTESLPVRSNLRTNYDYPAANRESNVPQQQSRLQPVQSVGSSSSWPRADNDNEASRLTRPSFSTFSVEDMDYPDSDSADFSRPMEFVAPISFSPRARTSAYPFAKADATSDTPSPPSTNNNNWRSQCQHQCSERLMDVTGVGVNSISPDKAEVRATVEYRVTVNTTQTQGVLEPKALSQLISQVQNEVRTRAAAVVQYLKKNDDIASHISKLHTTGLSLEPLYEYVNNHMQLSGYRASNSITFRVDVAQAGEAVDAVVKHGVTRIDGVNFISSPKELAAARQVAIANAVEDGLSQALSALSGAGRVSGPWKSDLQIVSLNIVGVTRPEPDNMSAVGFHRAMPAAAPIMRMEKLEVATTPIEGEERTISAAVVLKLRF